jgi:hypothetical protein
MTQPIPCENIEYERYVDGLRKSSAQMLTALKDTRAELQTLFDEDYDYAEIDAAIAIAEGTALPAPSKTITIHLEGGLVQHVTGIPARYEVRVEDYDEGDMEHPSWDEEKQCFVTVYEGGANG